MNFVGVGFFSCVFLVGTVFAAIDPKLDQAATKFEELTEHFVQTVHADAKQVGPAITHLDTDAHELEEVAAHFHEEVHHDHGHVANVQEFKEIQEHYSHTSTTFYKDYFAWSEHIQEDWRLIRAGFYAIDTALFWSSGKPGHGHSHDGHRH